MILFLDYDGVLHPDEVFVIKGRPQLRAEGQLFMWAPILEEILFDFPEVRIVLSTSWARDFGFRRARRKLPQALKEKTIAATWHSGLSKDSNDWPIAKGDTWWDNATRYEQIKRYVDREGIKRWVAIDDKPVDWPDDEQANLIKVDGQLGLSSERVQEALVAALKAQSQTD